jgi:hypothetical protein
MIGKQSSDHFLGLGPAGFFFDGAELHECREAARGKRPNTRMRSATSSTAVASSVYWASNSVCRVVNIGPVTFQWKFCVFRYSA